MLAEIPPSTNVLIGATVHVLGGVPGQDAAEAAVRHVEGQHRPHVEPQSRVCLPGDRDHLRRQVDPGHGYSEVVKVCRGTPGAAPDVGDWPGPGVLDALRERGQHRPVQWPGRQLVPEALRVVAGHSVVGRAGAPHKVRLVHGAARYSSRRCDRPLERAQWRQRARYNVLKVTFVHVLAAGAPQAEQMPARPCSG
jgi:hypothetical protein